MRIRGATTHNDIGQMYCPGGDDLSIAMLCRQTIAVQFMKIRGMIVESKTTTLFGRL
ncbi:MAG: hypothetical protein OEQ39_28410 [Gammaproteobacteria bacterium]|nr:hypothetical protein [Gammaproteobacteria bacterium]MDH3464617.1 hypothetical protein [Gammaproteobacteria bacterium]